MLASDAFNADTCSNMPEHLRIYDSPDRLADAAELILTDTDLDIVVTQGFGDRTQGSMWSDDAALYAAVPELHDVNAVIAKWWEDNGPEGFCIAQDLSTWFGVWTPIEPHLDGPLEPTEFRTEKRWFGPITATIMHKLNKEVTQSVFKAQNPNLHYDPDQYVDWATDYETAYLRAIAEQQEATSQHQGLRTSYAQSQGEILFFRNFPSPTMHGTEIAGGVTNEINRLAQVITGFVARAETHQEKTLSK